MKKLILMIAVVLMAFTASFAQDRQHADQATRDRDARARDRAAVQSRDTRVNTGYQSNHRYRSQSRRHRMRTRHYRRTDNNQ